MKKFKKLVSEQADSNQIQANVEEAFNQINTKAIVDGVLLKDIILTTGIINKISHKLGRKPLGYIIVRRNANSTIYDNSVDNKTINLNCTANVTVSIWVF